MKAFRHLCAFLVIAFYLLSPLAVLAQGTPAATATGQPSCTMSVYPGVISPGGSTALSWSSINATGGMITGVGSVGPNGSLNVLPSLASQTTFVGTFSGLGGTATCSATVQVSYGSNTSGGTSGGTVTGGTDTSGGGTVTPAPVTTSQASQTTPGSLVPCGGSDTIGASSASAIPNSSDATGCQACSLAQLVQNIINFAIGISIPIAAALFAWAGILYFTSGADPGNKDKAKSIFKNAFIGFLIAISGWLIVNTILHTILNSTYTNSNGSWFTIQCSAGRQVSGSINTLLNSVLPGVTTNVPTPISTSNGYGGVNGSGVTGGNAAYQCGSGYTLATQGDFVSCNALDGNGGILDSVPPLCTSGASPNSNGQCTDQNGQIILPNSSGNMTCPVGASPDASGLNCQSCYDNGDGTQTCETVPPVVASPLATDNTGACDPNAVSAAATTDGISLSSQQASFLACVAKPESSCGTQLTGSQTSSGVQSSAVGAFQVVVSTNATALNNDACTQAAQSAQYNVASGGLASCKSAVYQGKPAGQYASMSLTDPNNLGEACIAAALNFNCQVAAASYLLQNNPSGSDWTGVTDGLNHSGQQACTAILSQ